MDPKLIKVFLNTGVQKGKKSINDKFFFKILSKLKMNKIRRGGPERPTELVKKVLDELRPHIKLRKFRKSGRSLEIPVPVKDLESYKILLRWLSISARDNKGGICTYYNGIASEFDGGRSDSARTMTLVRKRRYFLYSSAVDNRINLRFLSQNKKGRIRNKKINKKYDGC